MNKLAKFGFATTNWCSIFLNNVFISLSVISEWNRYQNWKEEKSLKTIFKPGRTNYPKLVLLLPICVLFFK